MDQLRSNCDVDSDSGANSITKFDPLLAAAGSPSEACRSIDLHHPAVHSLGTPSGGLLSYANISVSKRQRSPNWTTKEDEQLARSWVQISTSPLCTSEQRGEEFFKRISDHFNHHWGGTPRTPAGVRERWGILQPACLRFNAIYHQIVAHCQRTQPGSNADHWRRLAHECFSEQTVTRTQRHRQFQYENVWEIVRHTPKFRPPSPSKPGPPGCSNLTTPISTTVANSERTSSIHVNGKLESTTKELDNVPFRHPTETNGTVLPSPSQQPDLQTQNKKRKTSVPQWLSHHDESDGEPETSPKSLLTHINKNDFHGTLLAHDKLALEREKFLADREERSKESLRKDKELELRIRASQRDQLMLDLQILHTNLNDCSDDTSKAALELLKLAVLKKLQNPNVT